MKTLKKRPAFSRYFVGRIKSNPFVFALMVAYSLLCVGSFIYFCVTGGIRDACFCLIYLLIVPAFYLIEWSMRIYVPAVYATVLMVFMCGNLLGACYNLYTVFPHHDDLLHALWGMVFMLFGFAIMIVLLGEPQSKKAFFAYLLFAFAFSLMTSVIWEIYEFSVDSISADYDLQEDTIINGFNSFFLYPEYDHLHTEQIEGIAYTILYNAQGEEIYRIEGGYLDIGLKDTMWDIIWCTVAAAGLSVVLAVERCVGKKFLYGLLVPKSVVCAQDEKTADGAARCADVGEIAEEAAS